MEDITVFKDKKKIHKEMLNIFNDIHKYIHSQNMISTSNEDIVELINDFNAIYDKLKKDEWNNPSDIIFLKKINNVTKNDVKLREYLNKMEYIKIYDILKKELTDLSEEQIRLLISSTSIFDDLDDSMYKNIVKCFSNSLIMKDLNEPTDFQNRVNKLVDYIECIQMGEDPINVSLENLNKDKEVYVNEDRLDSGIFTIDRIYKYYINQVNNLSQILDVELGVKTIININRIKYIKKLNQSTQMKFIELIKMIKNIKLGLINEIEGISNLVEIFDHFKDEIDKIEIDTLNNLFSFMFINKLNINEIDDYYRGL